MSFAGSNLQPSISWGASAQQPAGYLLPAASGQHALEPGSTTPGMQAACCTLLQPSSSARAANTVMCAVAAASEPSPSQSVSDVTAAERGVLGSYLHTVGHSFRHSRTLAAVTDGGFAVLQAPADLLLVRVRKRERVRAERDRADAVQSGACSPARRQQEAAAHLLSANAGHSRRVSLRGKEGHQACADGGAA